MVHRKFTSKGFTISKVLFTCIVIHAWLMSPCNAGSDKIILGDNKPPKITEKTLARKELRDSLLGIGMFYEKKGNYVSAKVCYNNVDSLAGIWRNENLDEAQKYLNQINRIEKLISMQGERPDWNRKLQNAKKQVSGVRSSNFDLWLIRIKAKVFAGDMARVLGETENAKHLYCAALGYQYFLANQDLTDISQVQTAEFEEISELSKARLRKVGLDPDELIQLMEEDRRKNGISTPVLPCL